MKEINLENPDKPTTEAPDSVDQKKKTLFDTDRLKKGLFIICSVLIGSVVAFTGLIGFVGIVVPHILRLILGPDHRQLLPASVFGGSLFVMVADTIARSPAAEIPVGAITALVGGPFFLYLLWKKKGWTIT